MKITKLIPAACLFSIMTACDTEKEIPVYSEDAGAIHIEATISSEFSRSNPVGATDEITRFNEGDEIQLTCEDGYLNYSLAGGKWSPTDNYYLRWGAEPMTYSAFYPVTSGTNEANFTQPANQQRIENLAKADYMTCRVENAVDNGSHILHLNMERRMAKVVMTLADVSGQNKANGVKIGSYSGYTQGKVNTDLTIVSPYITVPQGVKAGQNGCSYTAIVTPGKASPSATFVTLNYLGDDMVLPGIPELEAGMCYEFTLKVEGSVITVSDPVVTPWTSGTIQGGDAEEIQLTAYYVKPAPTGNASGADWDNAMGADALRSLLAVNSDKTISDANADRIDGKNVYMAAGNYEIAKDNSGVKIEYTGYSKQVEINIMGGYDPASTGTDVSRRDVNRYVTSWVRKTGSSASATSDAMLVLGNQIDLRFDGCTLDGQYGTNESGNVRAFFVASGGTGDATLRMENCVIRNFNRGSDGGTDGGAAMKIAKGKVFLSHTEIADNIAKGRGGAFTTNNAASYLFMNSCLLHGNSAPTAWGTTIHAGNGFVCMNNVTVIGAAATANTSVTVNGDACFILANTTITGNAGNPNGVFRSGKVTSYLINNLFVKGAGTRTLCKGRTTSGGYNVYQDAESGWEAIDTDTDYSSQSLPAPALTDGVYQWTPASIIDSYATRQAVFNGVKSFNAAGAEFATWVGEAGFGVDQRGAARNAGRMQAGAYDAGL